MWRIQTPVIAVSMLCGAFEAPRARHHNAIQEPTCDRRRIVLTTESLVICAIRQGAPKIHIE